MTKSPDFGVPLLAQAQANPDITHNEALMLFQALSNGVINMTTSVPPGSPTEGDSYVIAAGPSGAWTGYANHIAIYWGGAWRFLPGRNDAGAIITIGARHEGLRVYDKSTNATYVWTGAAWSSSAVGPFVLKAGDTMSGPLLMSKTAAVEANLNGVPSCKVQIRGEAGKPSNLVFITEGIAGANSIGVLYRDSADSVGFWGYKARGTEAAPTAILQNDSVFDLTGYGHNGTAFARVFQNVTTCIAVTPSPTDMETRWRLSLVAPGAATATEVATLSHRYGFTLFGVQVITEERLPVKRVTTVAGLASFTGAINGACAIVTDANATTLGTIVAGGGANRVPVNYDGTNWRIG